MSATALFRLPPAGDPYGPSAWLRIATREASADHLAERLALRLGAPRVRLTRSGREALRQAFGHAARATGRGEVLIPAYTCFSVPAAAVAAGLRVRLVDVDEAGRIDLASLSSARLDDVAAVVVCNLFGRAEPIAAVREAAGGAGAWVIDDAAQSFGARAPGEVGQSVGARGELGVLSFGRGKPLCGLGGGAWVLGPGVELPDEGRGPSASDRSCPSEVPTRARPAAPAPARARAAIKAVAWDVALRPSAFSLLASVPALGIGETPFDPDFPRGEIDGASVVLADDALDHAAASAARREQTATRLAEALHARTRFRAVLPEAGEISVVPRLAVRAPDAATRAAALAALSRVGAGASALYPAALSRVEELRPQRADSEAMPGAEHLAERLFTLPVNGSLRGRREQAALDLLAAF